MNKVLAYILLAIIIISHFITTVTVATHVIKPDSINDKDFIPDPNWRGKIPSKKILELASEPVFKESLLVSNGLKIVGKHIIYENTRKYIVLADNDEETIEFILRNSVKLVGILNYPNDKALYHVYLTTEQLETIAKNPNVYKIMVDIPFAKLIKLNNNAKQVIEKLGIGTGYSNAYQIGGGYLPSYDLLQVPEVWEKYNITGDGVVVGVVDTGVDFSNPELGLDAIARDEEGNPLILAIDYGIILFTANVTSINGTLNIANLSFPVFDPFISRYYGVIAIYFIQPGFNLTVGNITSASGYYRVGFALYSTIVFMETGAILVRLPVPAVMVDSEEPGVYDRVYFDLSTAFYNLLSALRQYQNETTGKITWREPDPSWLDYSIADEPWFGPGKEVVARDFDGDGIYDFSIGTITGYYLDTLGLVNASFENGEITLGLPGYYKGWDYSGRFLALMNDYYGHGTSVATLLAGRGRVVYPIYGGTTIKGVAPNAKIATGEMFWASDDQILELWLAGFEPIIIEQDGEAYMLFDPYGPRRADIISNSWGHIYLMFWAQNSPGTDIMSAFYDYIAVVRNYLVGEPVILVFAAGNEGPGYGSVNSPGAGLLLITVGASTWYGFAWHWGRGWLYDDIAVFSSRGPNSLGYPKPDVVNIGDSEYAGTRTIDGEGYGAFVNLFGGTSEATPLTSGVLALIIEATRKTYNVTPDPIMAKIVLKSSADDLGYPVFMQGAGRVNALKAVELVMEGEWAVVIADGIREAFLENYLNMYGLIALNISSVLYDTSYYTVAPPGTVKNFTLAIYGYGEALLEAQELVEYKEYIAYDGLYNFSGILRLTIPRYAYSYSDFIEITVLFQNLTYKPYEFSTTPIDDQHPMWVVVYDWRDYDQDGEIDDNEVYYIGFDYRIGVETTITISKPCERIEGKLRVLLVSLGTENVTPVKTRVVIKSYKYVESNIISIPHTVNVQGEAYVPVTIEIPDNALPGVREIRLVIDTETRRIVVPVSILIPLVIDNISTTMIGLYPPKYRYNPFKLRGLYDMVYGKWEGCDWRLLPILITDPEITGVLFIARWGSGYASDLAFTVIPPGGPYNELGSMNIFASYKLAYDLGLVYNPSLRDQIRGKLRLYLPVKWALPIRSVDIYILALGLYPPLYSMVSAEESTRPVTIYGVYRLFYGFTSYSGKYIEDRILFRIITVKAKANYNEIDRMNELSIGYVEFEFKAGAYAPFLFTYLYVETNSSTTYPLIGEYTYMPTSIYGEGIVTNMTYYIVTYTFNYYLGTVIVSKYFNYTIPFLVNTSDSPEIDIMLLNFRYPWHAEGLYIYDEEYGLYVYEIIYPGIITTITSIS